MYPKQFRPPNSGWKATVQGDDFMPDKAHIFFRVFGAVFLLTLGATITQAQAQQSVAKKYPDRTFLDSSVEINLQRATMAEIVKHLSEAAHLSILVDGEPDSLDRNAASFQIKATKRDVLDRLANAFDYEWSLTKANVVLLRKRFMVRGERPQTHVAEMKQLMKDIVAAFNLAPRIERGDPRAGIMNQLARTLTPEQLAFLVQGNKTRAADLRPDQLSLVHAAILASTFGVLEEKVSDCEPFISNFASLSLVVKEQPNILANGTGADQTSASRHDYLLVVRDKNKKLLTQYLKRWYEP